MEPGEALPANEQAALPSTPAAGSPGPAQQAAAPPETTPPPAAAVGAPVSASPLAARIAAEHNLDLTQVQAGGSRVEKADVMAYLASRGRAAPAARLVPASPKARRLAHDGDLDLGAVPGSGPDGAVLAQDVLNFTPPEAQPGAQALELSTVWRVMAERMTLSWTTVPHFFLLREIDAARLATWLASARARTGDKLTYTDLLVKLTALALRDHPRLNAAWSGDSITLNPEINIAVAVAVEAGLMVPVIHAADRLNLRQIAERRRDVVERAQSGRLKPQDINGGTFTLTNLGMYGVDAFNAIINPPQAAILAVGRIADRVAAVDGQPVVRPMMTLSLSCDHRVVDGARGAQFLDTLAGWLEDPLAVFD
jgi:pyruvate dehydrogenase E2 component (dihydrolipoamide acetyltransferase)